MSVIKWWHERVFCMCDVVCEIGGCDVVCEGVCDGVDGGVSGAEGSGKV